MTYGMILDGQPVPKQRPRMTRTGHTYTPQKTRQYENYIATEWIRQNGKTLLSADLDIKITLCMEVPKSWSRTKIKQALNGDIRPSTRPDIDNLIKAILDGLNGVAYEDDRQIVSITAEKFYTKKPRTIVTIESEG